MQIWNEIVCSNDIWLLMFCTVSMADPWHFYVGSISVLPDKVMCAIKHSLSLDLLQYYHFSDVVNWRIYLDAFVQLLLRPMYVNIDSV